MSDLRKAAEKVLQENKPHGEFLEALDELRQALAQPEQEPVAWMTHTDGFMPLFHKTRESALNWQTQPTPLYTAPLKREWQGLTESEIVELAGGGITRDERMIARAIEAKLKEKNDGNT